MRILLLLLVPFLLLPAHAQNSDILPTDKGALNVDFETIPGVINPGDDVKFALDFVNPTSGKVQVHIDYRITVTNPSGDEAVLTLACSTSGLCHTSTGSVTIPGGGLDSEGVYSVLVEVEGILFQLIPVEAASFDVLVGDADLPTPPDDNGSCLIATAAYGSELAPQVQLLREVRDGVVLRTESGSAFMGAFNSVYYTFSPAVADYERENAAFREVVRAGLAPLLATLSVFNHVEIDSEQDMLAYGLGVIFLNIGIYVGMPAFATLKLYRMARSGGTDSKTPKGSVGLSRPRA